MAEPEPHQPNAMIAAHAERVASDAADRSAADDRRREEQDLWIGRTLAREERLTRFLSYGSLFFGAISSVVAVAALISKLIQG